MAKSNKPHENARWRFLSKVVPALFACESVFLFYMALQPRYAVPSIGMPFLRGGDLEHFLAYLAYGILACGTFSLKIRDRKKAALATLAWCALYGGIIEGMQAFVPSRLADPLDWVADVLGSGAGVLVAKRFLLLEKRKES